MLPRIPVTSHDVGHDTMVGRQEGTGGKTAVGWCGGAMEEKTGGLYDDSSAPELPELEGYLFKLKHKTALLGGWTKRWFRIDHSSGSLEYYANEAAAKSRSAAPSTIPLSDVLAVRTPSPPRMSAVAASRRTFESPFSQ